VLPPRNTSARPSVRPSVPLVTSRHVTSRHVTPRHATPTPTPMGSARRASARACDTPISFIQLHKRCTERLPNKLDGRLLQYPYGISLFPLALNTRAFNSFIITINGPRPIYLTCLSPCSCEELRDGFGSDTHGYEFGFHYLPHFISNSNTNTNIIKYECKTDISNSDLHSNTYSIYSIES
jgi:hypothetical protein